jgi:pimeloyl-ACP methyl ester carboxylesterase
VDRTIAYKSSILHYREEGEGFPVLLLHGLAEDGTLWDTQMDFLRKDYRLIIPDLPGSGRSLLPDGDRSSNPGTPSPFGIAPSIDELADAVKTLCDKAGVGQCILIGHSMGGYVALAFAQKYPDRLRALGLFHSTAYPDGEEKKASRRKTIDFIRKNGSSAFIRQSIPNLFSENSREKHPELIKGLIDRYSGFQPEALIYYQEAMIARPDRTSVLQHFAGPVLFIIGGQDNAVSLDDSLRQSHIPTLSQIFILENTGHMGMLEDPSRSNRFLQSFINFTLHS